MAAVDRALAIVLALGRAAEPQTLTELSRQTSLYKSTVLRLLNSLIHSRFVYLQDDGRYRLGSAFPLLFRAYERLIDLRAICTPVLNDLSKETGESAIFFTREGNRRLCLLRVDGRHNVREHLPVGTLLPLDRGAAGHVLTIFDDPANLDGRPLVVASYGERDPEIAAIAAPVFGPGPTLIGSICLTGTVTRLKDRPYNESLRRTLLLKAEELTESLGGDPALFRG